MTIPRKSGEPISYEQYQAWMQNERDQRLRDAAARAGDGDNDWASLTHMMGRNELPDILYFMWMRLPHDQLVKAVSDAWVGCEFPERKMHRREWLPIFRKAGYHDEETPAVAPERITLYRGGVKKTRMAWTADHERAEWFQHRYDHLGTPGKLWTITVTGDRLLAHYHEKHRREDEYVIDPTGIRPKQL